MKHLRAKIVPYSSTVGTSLLIYDQGGAAPIAQLALFSVRVDEGQTHRGQSEAIAEIVKNALSSTSPPAPLGGMTVGEVALTIKNHTFVAKGQSGAKDGLVVMGTIAAARAILASAASRKAEPDPWRPIAEAAKNHFPILTWSVEQGQCVAFLDVTWTWWSVPAREPLPYAPTHYRPLPEPPTAPPSTETEVG